MVVTALAATTDTLVILQNGYPNWEANVNNRQVAVEKKFVAFMAVPLEKGRSEVTLYFKAGRVILYFLIALLTATLLGWLALRHRLPPPGR